ncbi:MAG: hypothetical protein ACR2QH_18220, partial [Geminicoccaceae bacterium]
MDLFVLDLPSDFDLPTYYVEQGHTVLGGTGSEQEPSRFQLGEFLTCVNVTKRLLRLQSFWIWTPWQLFRFLTDHSSRHRSWRLISGD